MGKIILTIALSVILKWQASASIEGRWLVDKVDVSAMKQKLTPQQEKLIKSFFIKPLTNAVFEFKADHHFYLSPGLANMPKDDYWEYDDAKKLITIREYNSKGVIMKIILSVKDDMTFFSMQESPAVLKVHKL